MRAVYQPTSETYTGFKDALHNDLGVFHVQNGAGIGGFFKSLFKTMVPIGKSLLKTGFEIAKPHLQQASHELVQAGTQAAIGKVNELMENRNTRKRRRESNMEDKNGRKRRRDAFS